MRPNANTDNILFKIRSNIFDVIYALEYCLKFSKDRKLYKQSLDALEMLNNDHKKLTGHLYVNELRYIYYLDQLKDLP